MEEKRIDPLQIIGFFLLFLVLIWMMYDQSEIVEQTNQTETETTTTEQIPSSAEMASINTPVNAVGVVADTLPEQLSTLQNKELRLAITSKGGFIHEAELINQTNYRKEQVYVVKDNNVDFNLRIEANGALINTRDLDFVPIFDGNQLIMRSSVAGGTLDYVYSLANDKEESKAYRFRFAIRSSGLSVQPESTLFWGLDGFRHALSADYENRYTQLTYQYEKDKVQSLSAMGEDDDKDKEVSWVSYRQHFFSMILIPSEPFSSINVESSTIMNSEDSDQSIFLKRFETSTAIASQNGALNTSFDWFIGPTDYEILKQYDENLSESISFGWGIIGWMNRFIFFPLFGFLSGFLPYGIAIIVMTVIVRLTLSPVTYKSYLSQAKMKVLRPEITALNEKYKNDRAKKQQETMKLYSKAGANPMAGCVPSLLQLPVFLGLFYFFPVAFSLRGKSFLWAEDLSSYDSILDLPFSIPFYGDHVSLFPLLASIAIFVYSKMTMGQQMQPSQPGMPNMKFMVYLMPVMMLFFFNNYASGLSLYYLISNVITIGIMLVIKNYIIDDEKIFMRIEENKKKPKKQSRFQRKMEEMMEQAEQQKRSGRRR
ncbi:MAG: membrane protein insertase YidC [Flavobacteriaceae bacterium]|nr:membrane protein insertase YidC [Flavobacteriaceae bacterium]